MWPTIICGNLNPKAKPSKDSQMFMIYITIPFKWALKLVMSIRHVFMESYSKSPEIISSFNKGVATCPNRSPSALVFR